jgi:hypothetical protein
MGSSSRTDLRAAAANVAVQHARLQRCSMLILHLLGTWQGILSPFLYVAQGTVCIGSSSEADLQTDAPNVAEQHARLQQRGGRTFCEALQGDEEDLTSDTYTWLDSAQLRRGKHKVNHGRLGGAKYSLPLWRRPGEPSTW